jgi:hypothetical protein
MDIVEVRDTMKRWIESSLNEEHLNNCQDAIRILIEQRFTGDEKLKETTEQLLTQIDNKRNSFKGFGLDNL